MKKISLILTMLLAIVFFANGQSVGKIELKESGFGQKKMAKAPKRIYISEFSVSYQMAYSQTSIARGGREIGGGYRGDAKASLSVAIPGIDPSELQKITDEVYQNYIKQLISEGFEIIKADEAGKTDIFSGWERMHGGSISQAQFPGYIATSPTGFDYYVRRITKKGRAKNGVFEYANKLSRQLDGAIIAKVNLTIPFVEQAEGKGSKALRKTFGGVAKVVVRPNFSLSPMESVQISKTGSATAITQSSYIYFASLKNQASVKYDLKKEVKIDGVFENKKYKAVESADQDIWGTQAGHLRVFNFSDREVEMTQPIPCDPEKYLNGAKTVVSQFVQSSLDKFLTVAKGK